MLMTKIIGVVVVATTCGWSVAGFQQAPRRRSPMGGALMAVSSEVADLRKMKVAELRAELGARNVAWGSFLEKEELVTALAAALAAEAVFCPSGVIKLGAVAEVSAAELEAEIQSDAPSLLLVDVFAQWCGPCQFMAPELVKAAKKLGASE